MSKKPELRLDTAKLREMKEPFLIRVEKMRGTSRMPIELPVRGDGLAPGEGWDRESVLKVDNWLATEWSGGGVYRILIVDAEGEKMEWESVFDPRTFPEKIPQTMQTVPSVPVMQQQAMHPGQPQQPQIPPQTSHPYGGWPPASWSPPPPVVQGMPQGMPQNMGMPPQAAPLGAQPPMQMAYGPWAGQWGQQPYGNGNGNGNGYRPFFNAPARRGYPNPRYEEPVPPMTPYRDEKAIQAAQDRERQLSEQIQKLERDRIQSEYQAQLDRLQQQHQMQMTSLQNEIRSAAEKTAAVPVNAPNPELEAIREQRAQFERERERAAADERFRQLQDLIAASNAAAQAAAQRAVEQTQQLIASLTTNQKSNGPDPAIIQLQEQMRQQQEQLQRERERAQAEQRFSELQAAMRQQEQLAREEARRQEDNFRRQLEAMQAQQAAAAAAAMAASANKTDPMLPILQQSVNQQVEAMREIARQQQSSFDRMSAHMMSPRDVIAVMKDSTSGFDDMRKNIGGVYNEIFNTQKMMIEHAMQLSGGGGPSMGERILENAVEKAGVLAERYMSVKRDTGVSDAKARQAQAEAMAAMASRQAQAQAQARTTYAPPAAAPVHTPPPPVPPAQVSAPAATAGDNGATAAGGLGGAATPAPNAKPMGKVIQMRRLGHTDEEWFGAAMPEVKKLRLGVAKFLESIAKVDAQGNPDPELDENGNPVGYGPEQCARFLIIGANRVAGMNLEIKAFNDLFAQERFADFLDVVLPEAPQLFRDDVVKSLSEELAGLTEVADAAEPQVEA